MSTAQSDISQRQLTVRLPDAALRAARRAAKARGITLNALVRQLLEDLERAEQERTLAAAYETLGADSQSDVEFAVPAQSKVARRG
jgi:predicted DNA binding CopG/RHH family protein